MKNILAFGPYWRAESLVGTTISQMMILLSRWRRIQTSKNGCDFDTLTAFMAWQLCFFVYYIYKPYKVIHRSTFHTRKWILDFPNRFNALLILHVNMLILFITLTVEFLIMTWAYHIDLISSFMTLYIHLLEWISLIV